MSKCFWQPINDVRCPQIDGKCCQICDAVFQERDRIIKLIVENGGLSRFISRTAIDSSNDDVEWEVRTVDLIALIKGEEQ